MTSQIARILKSYEELSLSISDIASEEGVSDMEIKIVLSSYSSKYKRAIKDGEKDLEFKEDEQEYAKQTLVRIMKENEHDNPELAANIAKYIRNDSKGRLDGINALRGIHLNVIEFNAQLEKVYASRERTLKAPTNSENPTLNPKSQIIDINSSAPSNVSKEEIVNSH